MSRLADHVHDCAGSTATCPCGYVFRVPPVSVSISVFDGNVSLVDEAFNCETTGPVVDALREAADKLEAMDRQAVIDVKGGKGR